MNHSASTERPCVIHGVGLAAVRRDRSSGEQFIAIKPWRLNVIIMNSRRQHREFSQIALMEVVHGHAITTSR
jgi:hypothetical protein